MAPTPGITKKCTKSPGASDIARNEQDETGWKNTANGSRKNKQKLQKFKVKETPATLYWLKGRQVVSSLALSSPSGVTRNQRWTGQVCVCWWQVMPVGGVSHHSLDAVTGRFASSKSNYLTVLGLTISKMGNSILIPISSKVKVENLDHRYSMKWLLLLFIYLGFECLEIDIQGWAAWNS